MKYLLISLIAVSGIAVAADAPADPPATPAPKSAAGQSTAESVTTRIFFGFDERLRTEDWNNISDFNTVTDDERRQVRNRMRFWMGYESSTFDFNVRMTDEFNKKYALNNSQVAATRLNLDEVVLDTLSFKIKKLPIHGLTLTIGRQDMQRGEGFILFDGTSGDGSRTQYFNAVNLAYQYKKSKWELIGILDPRQDRFLGLIHDQHKYLQEWDEQALGLYYTNRDHKDSDIDAYYFYKKEVHDYRAATNVQFQPDRHVNTLGARLVRRLPRGFSATGEFAGQWGAQHGNAATARPRADIRAWGGYGYLKRTFATRWKPYVLAGYWALSGDDQSNTKTRGGFDPLFSRWPKWSEMYIYSQVPEVGVAYWTNNRMFQMEAGASPTKHLTLRATFYEESAFHPYTRKPTVFDTGTHRGENYQVRADYLFNSNWKAHMLYERLNPGDFYKSQCNAFFVQAQVTYSFNMTLFRSKSASAATPGSGGRTGL